MEIDYLFKVSFVFTYGLVRLSHLELYVVKVVDYFTCNISCD